MDRSTGSNTLTGDCHRVNKPNKDLGAAGLDYHMGVIKKHPEWIKEAHDLGLKVNVWTVDKAEDMKWLIDQKVDFITTNEPTVAQEILK